MDCEAALEACARGDRSGLRALYDAEGARLVAVARRILRRRDLAEEAVQETFVAIWRKAGQWDRAAGGSARGWITAIARNRALDMARDGAREDLTAPEDIDAARADEPEAALDRLEAGALRRCLEALDADKRRAVLLALVRGLTHGEIAATLAVPLSTAKAWVRRGLLSLRECLS